MGPIHAFFTGIRRALVYWPAWLILFLATLLTAVPLALFPAGSLLETARRTVIEDMTSGFKTWQILDVIRLMRAGAPVADQAGLTDALAMQNMVYVVLLTALVPLMGGFVSAFFWGGVLVTYQDGGKAEASGAGQDAVLEVDAPAQVRFRMGRFFWGCWHWFGSFLLLAIGQAGLFIGILMLLIGMELAASALGEIASIAALVIILLFLGLWMAVFELARVQCVVSDTRNIFTGLGRAITMIFRQMPRLIVFYVLALLALLLVHLVFRAGLMPRIPAQAVLVTLLAQQAFILARLFALALRLAGLTAIAQAYLPEKGSGALAVQQAAPGEEQVREMAF